MVNPYQNGYAGLSKEALYFIGGLLKHAPVTDEALDELEKDQDFLLEGGVFPQRLIEIWIANKRAEARRVNNIPHPQEFELYYDL